MFALGRAVSHVRDSVVENDSYTLVLMPERTKEGVTMCYDDIEPICGSFSDITVDEEQLLLTWKVNNTPYTAHFKALESKCCEHPGVEKGEIDEVNAEDIISVRIGTRTAELDPDWPSDVEKFCLDVIFTLPDICDHVLGKQVTVSFYNIHNGYYSHELVVSRNNEPFFKTWL